jgi:hypothetical protein
LEAFTKKENAERKRETEDINEALRTENEKRIKEAQALKDKMERENKEMQVGISCFSFTNNLLEQFLLIYLDLTGVPSRTVVPKLIQ